jgi:uncharacterized protein YqeY
MLIKQISSDLKNAMRDKKEQEISTLRMLKSAIKNKEISLRNGNEAEMTDEKIIEIISSEVKKRVEAAGAYEQGERIDLAEKEKSEIKILERYLPAQISEEEIEKTVKAIIIDEGLESFGQTMAAAVKKLKGKASGSRISEAVKKALNKNLS